MGRTVWRGSGGTRLCPGRVPPSCRGRCVTAGTMDVWRHGFRGRGWSGTSRGRVVATCVGRRLCRLRRLAMKRPSRRWSGWGAAGRRGLSTGVNVLDPDAIVLGGGLSNLDRLYDGELAMRLRDYGFGGGVETPILKNQHGDSSGVRGAAWLWA